MIAPNNPEPIRLSQATILEAKRLWAERQLQAATTNLLEFMRQGWDAISPGEKFYEGRHIEAYCDHLTYAAKTPRYDLVCNVPPGCMKSLAFSVFFPCWVWTWWPRARVQFASYSQEFAYRDSNLRRALIKSEWYRSRWGGCFGVKQDQTKMFLNSANGWFYTTSMSGGGTGYHSEFFIIDDPHKAQEAESEAERKAVIEWLSAMLPSRGMGLGVRRLLIMQRLHQEDASGYLLALKGLHFDHLVMRMEYEKDDDARPATRIGWKDWRTQEGELLWPEFMDQEKVQTQKALLLTQYRIASQLQQRPQPKEGGMFKLHWFHLVEPQTDRLFDSVVRYWDKAGTEDEGAYSAGVLIGKYMVDHRQYQYYVLNVVRGQWSALERNKIMLSTAALDKERYGGRYAIWMEQEPGSGGKESAQISVRELAGYNVHAEPVSRAGDKETRAAPFAAQCENGNVFVVKAAWNQPYFDELCLFPHGKYADQVDASGGAFNKLAIPKARLSLECHYG